MSTPSFLYCYLGNLEETVAIDRWIDEDGDAFDMWAVVRERGGGGGSGGHVPHLVQRWRLDALLWLFYLFRLFSPQICLFATIF